MSVLAQCLCRRRFTTSETQQDTPPRARATLYAPEEGPFLSVVPFSQGGGILPPAFGFPMGSQTRRNALALIALLLALAALLTAAYDIWLTVYLGPSATRYTPAPPMAEQLLDAGVVLALVGLLCAASALICGILALTSAHRYAWPYRRLWMAISAIVLGPFGGLLLLLWILLLLLYAIFAAVAPGI